DNPSCGGGAGGITLACLNEAGCHIALSFTTVSGNSCYGVQPGAGIPCPGGISSVFASDNGAGKFAVKNVILANNSAGGNCAPVFALFVSDGYNLSDDATCASVFTQTGDLNNTPAGLDPGGLKNNGGPTQTIALLATSPAVNAIPLSACTDASGIPVTTDQRGVHRPQGSGCDVGAYEYFQSRYVDQAVQTLLLIDAVQSSPLPQIVQQPLNAPLQAAVDSLNQGNVQAASGQLGAFVIMVHVRGVAGGLSQDEADAWTGSATAIIQSLGN
ncbi:MAG TPA: choice-of-anchor Q domain-containing protein, partial [Terriglobales bacterium]